MLLKVKAKFVSDNNIAAAYLETTLTYLMMAENFSDAEKAVLEIVKKEESPKNGLVQIIKMDHIPSIQIVYKESDKRSGEEKFYEVAISLTIIKKGKQVIKKRKYLIEADSIEQAKNIATKEMEMFPGIFDTEKTVLVKETDIYKSYA